MHNRLIFDELQVVMGILENGFQGGKSNEQEMSLLAKYYRWEKGLGQKGIEKELIRFCKEHDKYFDEIDDFYQIEYCIKQAMKYRLRKVSPVIITKFEIENIKKVKDFKKQKFLFCMLVYAKALKFSGVREGPSTGELKEYGYYVKNSFLREIKSASGVRDSYEKVLFWLHDYKKLGLIKTTKRKSIRLPFGEFQGDPAFVVETETGMVDEYNKYCGGEIAYCEVCGEEVIKNSNRKKMCNKCWKDKQKELFRINSKNYRERKSS
jgi:hypothetical protein